MASLYSSASNAYTISGKILDNQEALTLSMWVYFIKRGEGWTSLLRKGKSGKSTPSLSISSEDGTIELLVQTDKDARYAILSRGGLATGRWTHVAVTISLSAAALYINGFLDSLRNFDSKVIVNQQLPEFNNDNITIGANEVRYGAEMFLDEFKVFNTFLSSSRIQANSAGTSVPFAPETVNLGCLDCGLKEVDFSQV